MKESKDNTFVKYMKIGALIAAVFVIFMEFKRCNEEKKENGLSVKHEYKV